MTTFIDGIVLTQKYLDCDAIKELAGIRSLAYRGRGDIRFDGTECEDEEVIGEQGRKAWIHGSHGTKIQVGSLGGLVSLAGNPGRWGRQDNLFNHDLDGTISRSNAILALKGLPPFQCGEPVATARLGQVMTDTGLMMATGGDMTTDGYLYPKGDGTYRQGARVWTIHVTRNFVTGSEGNAVAVLNWLDGQSVARVKKKRFGRSTVVWGNLRYCQVEAYLKADELLSHCNGEIERQAMKQNPAYLWAKENGIVRIEVKAAKDYLRDRGLTYLGAWTMEKVIQLFDERTELLHRVKCDLEEFDPTMLPSRIATTAAAWMQGVDVTTTLSRATFYRHAAALREYGIDIAEKRNVRTMPVRIKTIEIQAAAAPHWYDLRKAA